MRQLEYIAESSNGMEVFYDSKDSHAATHLEDTPQLAQLVSTAISNTNFTKDVEFFEFDFGKTVGRTDLVKNNPDDEIIYAKRKNREVYTPFNKTQLPKPCSVISVYVERIELERYELKSAWVGYKDSPAFPGDPDETPESKDYWMSHSLTWGTQEVQPKTVTSTCPW